MTQQQIIDAGIDYTMSTHPVCMGGAAFEEKIRQFNRNGSFEAGAEWAKEKLIQEACEWLNNYATLTDYTYGEWYDKERLIKDFKQAMEK